MSLSLKVCPNRKITFSLITYFALLLTKLSGENDDLISQTTDQISDKQAALIISEFKQEERGPFGQIRWFCNDGRIIVPRAGNCNRHGDGVQHGEYNADAKLLRSNGYFIANVFADIDESKAVEIADNPNLLAWITLERYLVSRDDGWIYRRARLIRGMFQAEDEVLGARRLMLALLDRTSSITQNYTLVREAARLFPGLFDDGTLHYVRAESARLTSIEPRFNQLKIKLHNQPEPKDADDIREFALKVKGKYLNERFIQLAENLEKFFDTTRNLKIVKDLIEEVERGANSSALREALGLIEPNLYSSTLSVKSSEELFEALFQLRKALKQLPTATIKLSAIQLSIKLEDFLVSQLLLRGNKSNQDHKPRSSALFLDRSAVEPEWLPRKVLLEHLYHLGKALYGIGVLTEREQQSLSYSVAKLLEGNSSVKEYLAELQYLQRVMSWTSSNLLYQFGQTLPKFNSIEPLITEFHDDRLRSSLLVRYGRLLKVLLEDSATLAKQEHKILDKQVFDGVRSMNAGLAKGTLIDPTASYVPRHDPAQSIYLVPETIAKLPSVAAILTEREGNPLSHVQLLARNLGIPNIVVANNVIAQLRPLIGRELVVAASRGGRVVIDQYDDNWKEQFASNSKKTYILEPDTGKLKLDFKKPINLSNLKSEDSGRRVGPKAAKLGELKAMFPDMVTEGVAIPFGIFNILLSSPYKDYSSLKSYLKSEYKLLKRTPYGKAKSEKTSEILANVRNYILNWQFPSSIEHEINQALIESFGRDGNYGVFVRSDTNVEDLPNFSGAGLNLTVPNVVGTDKILQAIKDVWASPFQERAFSWRQSWMTEPEELYVSVLLLKTVPVEKSGVMLTGDIETGDLNYLTVAVNEGLGGAVDNQKAEAILLNRQTGVIRLLSRATALTKKVASPNGGIITIPTTSKEEIMSKSDLLQLNRLALRIHDEFPGFDRDNGTGIADVEFGFLNGRLKLFQIRPFVEDFWTKEISYLKKLDQTNDKNRNIALSKIDLNQLVLAKL